MLLSLICLDWLSPGLVEARNNAVLFPASTNGLTVVVIILFLFCLVLLHNTAYNCHIG